MRNTLVAVLTIAMAAANLALSPLTAGAAVGDALVRVSTSPFGEVHDVDYDAGRLAVADTELDQVVIDGQTIGGTAGSGDGQFDDPRGIAWGPSAVYVSDSGNNRVQEFVLVGLTWTYNAQWSLGATADPRGLDVASNGLVYVADAALDVVHVIDPAGGVATFATGLSAPTGVAFDGTDIVVADTGNDALKKYSLAGALDGTFSPAGLNDPADVAADRDGNLFVTELFADDIRAFDTSGADLFAFGSTGSGIDQFSDPRGIAVADDSQLYIADSLNDRVELYRHNAEVSVDSTTASVIEDAGSLDVTVNLSAAAAAPVTVTVTASDATAVSPADYTFATADLTINAGDTSGTVTVDIIDDNDGTELEGETFDITISEPVFAVLGSDLTTTVTIDDDDIVARSDLWDLRLFFDAADLSLVTNVNEPLIVTAAEGVLVNDDDRLDADAGDFPNEVDTNTVPSAGTVGVNDDGSMTYNPPTDFLGEATFTYTVIDGSATESANVAVRVNGPVTAGADSYTVAEDGSLDTAVALDPILENDNDGEDTTIYAGLDPMYVESLDVDVADGTLSLSTGPGSDGHFTYAPDADFNGTDSFTYTVSDGRGSSDSATVTITVTEVNDDPSFTLTDQAIDEDAGAQTVDEADWLTAINDGDPTGSTTDDQVVTFSVTDNSNTALFASGPTVALVDDEWELSYEAVADANGSATVEITGTDDGETDGASDAIAVAADMIIAVGDVNDAPTVTPVDQVVDEDDGPIVLDTATWASALSGTDLDAGLVEILSFVDGAVVQGEDNPVVFATDPSINPITGEITFTVAGNDHGSFTLPITVTDDYGTPADELDDESTTVNLAVRVDAVNDAPVVVTKPINAEEDPDPAGESYAVGEWTSTLNDGDPTSDATDDQTLDYTLTSVVNGTAPDDVTFAVDGSPAIDSETGELTFTLLPNENGSFTVNVDVGDDGDTENGGIDSTSVSFVVTVDSVNDDPTFTLANQTVNEDAGAQTVLQAGWITDILDGDPTTGPFDTQNVTIAVTDNDTPALFAAAPVAVDDGGWELRFTPAADAHGVATVTVTATDDNGTPGVPGDDKSTDETMTITVNSVNDAPVFVIGDISIDEDPATPLQKVAITGIDAGAANESAQVITFSVTNDNAALFAVEPFVNGDNELEFTPATDANGTAAVTVTANDGGGTDFGGVEASSTPITITVNAVNDAPTVTPANQTFTEDDNGGSQSYAASVWSSPAPSGSDPELTEVLTYSLDSVAAGTVAFDTDPAVSASGDLTFDAEANANGTFTVTIDVTDDNATPLDGSDDETTQVDVDITITPVNDAPTVTPANQSFPEDEDNGDKTYAASVWSSPAPSGSDPELTEALTYSLDSVAAGTVAFDTDPAVSASGDLTFDAEANANGTFTVTIDVTDDNATPLDGSDDETTQVDVDITITPVNDAPTVTPTDQTVDEDKGPYTVLAADWAPDLNDGDREITETLSFAFDAAPLNIGLNWAVLPAIDPATGDITFAVTADENGSLVATINITDDNETPGNSGDDETTQVDVTITVAALNDDNDVPSFDAVDQGADEDAAPVSVPFATWATNVDDGDNPVTVSAADNQALTYAVTDNTNADLFLDQPAIGAGNALTFTPAPNANMDLDGDATITVTITDDGGTPGAGLAALDDLSSTDELVISIAPVEDPEAAVDDEYIVDVDEDDTNEPDDNLIIDAANGLVANDEAADVDGDTLTVLSNEVPDFGEVAVAGDGSFSYDADPFFIGDATFTYEVTDGEGTYPSDTGTVLIKVNGRPTLKAGAVVEYITDEDVEIGFTFAQLALLFEDVAPDTVIDTVSFSDAINLGAGEGSLAVDLLAETVVYTPADDFTGTATFDLVVTDGRLTATETLSVKVNAAPAPTDDTASVLEDGTVDISAAGLISDDTDVADDVIDTVTFVGVDDAASEGTVTRLGDTITYTPPADFNGPDSFTYTVTDGRLISTGTVDVTVTPVNDAPEFTLASDQVVFEDGEAASIASFYSAEDEGGGSDEDTQALTLTVSSDTPGLFTDQPAIANDGTLTFDTADDAVGTATVTVTLMDDGGTDDGGIDSTASTFTIDILELNDAPIATIPASPDQTTLEDSGVNTVADFVTDIGPGGGPDEAGQTVSLVVTNDNNALFAVQPAVDGAGVLTYTPAPNANGPAEVTLTFTDDGSVGSGHFNTTVMTFDIDVTAVNDAPSFTPGADVTVDEDSGTTTIEDWASSISTGPADESAQSASFTVVDTSVGVFSTPPAITDDGDLSFTVAPDAVGSATVEITLVDSGGTDNGGENTFPTAPATIELTINITPFNDAPIATIPASPNQTTLEDSGLNTVAGFVTDIGPGGGPDESGQTVALAVTNNNALFAVQPAVDGAGVLTYTPAPSANGTAEVTLTFTDDGPVGPGHVNTTVMTFDIDIVAVNDAPSFTPGADVIVDEGSGTTVVEDWATGISTGPADEFGQDASFTVVDTSTGLFSAGPAISDDGELSFTVVPGADGEATIEVSLVDSGGTANAGKNTFPTPPAIIELTITVNDAPEAFDDEYITDIDTTLVVTEPNGLLDNDEDGDDSPVISSNTSPAGALFLETDGSFAYVPPTGFVGTDSFTYTIDDGRLESTATVEIYVNGPPTASLDSYEVDEDELLTVPAIDGLLDNDFDDDTIDDDIAVVAETVLTDEGVAVDIATDGSFSYQPAADFNGSDSFEYTVEDDRGVTATGTVNITVTPVNDAPVAVDDSYTVDEDTTLAVVAASGLAVNDTDPADGAAASTSVVPGTSTSAEGVSVVIEADGAFSYTPMPDFFGTDTFTYTATDGELTDTGTVTITVTNVNDAPVALDDVYVTERDTALEVNEDTGLLISDVDDFDVDGDVLTVATTNATTSEGVSVDIEPDGSFIYEPPAGFTGTDTFSYVVTDGQELSNSASVSIEVQEPDDLPVLQAVPFNDVPLGSFYYEPVQWAVACSITSGTSPTAFSPDDDVNRAQFLTFLYRLAGSPEVTSSLPFTDVAAGSFYEEPVRWAYATGVTTGTSPTTFSPDDVVTRGQVVTLLHRYYGNPVPSGAESFDDVSPGQFFYDAVRWAVNAEEVVTNGTSPQTFSPFDTATRAQALTLIRRANGPTCS